MLGKTDATPMIAVKDLNRARDFYEGKLGLKAEEEWGREGVTLKSGDTLINVYRSEFAGTNKATALNFDVDDIEEGMKTAWFKDPDGNILSLIEGGE